MVVMIKGRDSLRLLSLILSKSLDCLERIEYEVIWELRHDVVSTSELLEILEYLVELDAYIFVPSTEHDIAFSASCCSIDCLLISDLTTQAVLTKNVLTREENWINEDLLTYRTPEFFTQFLVDLS